MFGILSQVVKPGPGTARRARGAESPAIASETRSLIGDRCPGAPEGRDGRPQGRPAAARMRASRSAFSHGLKAPFDSPACADSLRTGCGFYRRPPSEDLMFWVCRHGAGSFRLSCWSGMGGASGCDACRRERKFPKLDRLIRTEGFREVRGQYSADSEVNDVYISPSVTEILCNESPVTMICFVLAAQQASVIENLPIHSVFDMPLGY